MYVLSNKGIQDLVKIGFSTKDPAMRAIELEGTGLPYEYIVEYDVLVDDPRAVEQATHRRLRDVHANKEFFKIDIENAARTIREVIASQGKIILLETEGVSLQKAREQSRAKANQRALAPVKLPARHFDGLSRAVECRCCHHTYSIAQVYKGEAGSALCPKCNTENWLPAVR